MEQNGLNDPATMADVDNHPLDKSFEDDMFQGYEDSTADDVIMDECNFPGLDIDATDASTSPIL